MSIPSAADLTRMRATMQQLAPEDWSVVRDTDASDGQGGLTRTPATVASGTAAAGTGARLAAGGTQAREGRGDILAAVSPWLIVLPHGTGVTARDRVVIGSRTFEVTGVAAPHSYGAAVRVSAVEVT